MTSSDIVEVWVPSQVSKNKPCLQVVLVVVVNDKQAVDMSALLEWKLGQDGLSQQVAVAAQTPLPADWTAGTVPPLCQCVVTGGTKDVALLTLVHHGDQDGLVADRAVKCVHNVGEPFWQLYADFSRNFLYQWIVNLRHLACSQVPSLCG